VHAKFVGMFNSLHHAQTELTHHPLFSELTTLTSLRRFMEGHIFAVWDFMSLLKRLQRDITCVEIPWRPSSHSPELVRFINQIVVGEESDLDDQGQPLSHFQLYLQAMKEVGADTTAIDSFLIDLDLNHLPHYARRFVEGNLALAQEGSTLEVAAAFFYGREKLIPDMFTTIVNILKSENLHCPKLMYYLERHIHVDGEEHGPLSEKCLQELCAGNQAKLALAEKTGLKALKARDEFWTGVLSTINSSNLDANSRSTFSLELT
jgi:hypothetical protein